ncbi:MAG: universal stress protein [Cyanobacteria bacterium SZAS LIN-3]|nr:universal stress protein [Cyanobacteria bacterium SZAS LIN-3]
MPFRKILVPVDGSAFSQLAVDYSIWLARHLNAKITAEHVIDPRILDFMLAPEFAEGLGFGQTADASEKVFGAMQTIGQTILDLVKKQCQDTVELHTQVDVGWVVEQIFQQAKSHDLVVVGHHGRGAAKSLTAGMIGSVAERIVQMSSTPVLVATSPVNDIKELVVAFDGSEPSRGALLLGQQLAEKTKKPLKALVVSASSSSENMAAAHLIAEQGTTLLNSVDGHASFATLEGPTTGAILRYTQSAGGLLILGAYGYRTPEQNVLGSTTTTVIRHSESSVLIFR